jgi:hypothetical protein
VNINKIEIKKEFNVPSLQTLSYSPTQSPQKFRQLSQPVPSFIMPSSETSVANPSNHSLTSFDTSFIAFEASATKKIPSMLEISENHLGPSL